MSDFEIDDIGRIAARLPRFKAWAARHSHEELVEKFVRLLAVTLTERRHSRRNVRDALKWRESRRDLRKLVPTIKSLVGTIELKEEGRRRANSKGGKKGAATNKQNASAWQDACVKAARIALDNGASKRTLASDMAARFQKSTQQVRTVLQAAGLLAKQKRS